MQLKRSTGSQDAKGQVMGAESVLKAAPRAGDLEGPHGVEEVSTGVLVFTDLGLNPCLATYYSRTALGKSLCSLSSRRQDYVTWWSEKLLPCSSINGRRWSYLGSSWFRVIEIKLTLP